MKLVFHQGKIKSFREKKNFARKQKEISSANASKHKKRFSPTDKRIRTALRYKQKLWGKARKKLFRELYKTKQFDKPPKTIPIEGEIGLESDVVAFSKIAEGCVDYNTVNLTLDLKKATRVWPTTVTLFASLHHWFNLTASNKTKAVVLPTRSDSEDVNEYLAKSGFYKYARQDTLGDYPQSESTVSIERELSLNFTSKLKNLRQLLQTKSAFNSDEEEEFSCIILSEIFINVTEHGVYDESFGWFVLAQCHPKHKFISICIADNGIGIKNSLITGPQREKLIASLGNKIKDEGAYVLESLKQNVSGAYSAPEIKRHKSPRGANRGRGLFLIIQACAKLGVKFNLISHRGSACFDENGQLIYSNSGEHRIFAGTLYHLIVPMKES